jgi:membrane dipeptidase
VERVADHAVHIANIGGKRCVALGSDFDGYIQKPAGLPDASALPALFTALERRGWTAAELDGLRGENFLSAWSLVQFK